MATADVSSLYTIISHSDGMHAVETFLGRDDQLAPPQRDFILLLLRFAMMHNYFWFGGSCYLQTRGVAMGAKFAPSMANLFMAKWEKDVVYADRWPELVYWGRYIDDILLLWDGDETSLTNYMHDLNQNTLGISLQFEMSKVAIHFLDLNIQICDNKFTTTTFFKETDRNGYISQGSCHHPSWLKAVPKSQFIRLRRNCTFKHDFLMQASDLKTKFVEKGYSGADLDKTINEVACLDRANMIKGTDRITKNNNIHEFSLVTTYSRQHYDIKKILRKHWAVLKNDKVLGPSLPERPQVIYRGVPPLRLQVAPNVLDAPNRVPFFQNSKGFFPCHKCKVCRINGDKNRKICQFKSNSATKVYDIDTFITCTSKNVVYLLTCPCGLQYVGRTMRAMNVRIKEHIKNIKKGFPKHTV